MTDDEIVYQAARFAVHRVALPVTGSVARQMREYIRPRDAVVILPMLDPETVVLIRNERFAVGETLWELPAGTMEAGEDPAQTAARELEEETGYRADLVEPMSKFFPTPGFCTERLFGYRATGLTEIGQSLDDTERITVHPTPWDDALAMCKDGRIQDAKTLALMLHHEVFGR